MKFTLGNRIVSKYKNTYVVEVKTMQGDADAYHYSDFQFKEEKGLEFFITELDKGAKRSIESRKDIEQNFPVLEEKYNLSDNWHSDEYGIWDDYDGYKIYYYNDMHEKFPVTAEPDKPAPRFGDK